MKVMKATIYVIDDEYDEPEQRLKQELELRGFDWYTLENIEILHSNELEKNVRRLMYGDE